VKTVRVPEEMAGLFAKAEEVVSTFFRDRKDDPSRGTIEIFGERYVLVRAASLSIEFFDLVRSIYGDARREEGDDFARAILFDLAHSIGRSDAQNFRGKMGLEDPIARLSAGPVHFAHAGWAFVEISPESRPTPDDAFHLVYDHPYSFESDAWVRAGRKSAFPVCIMNAGYSSGWCEESFGTKLVASELLCRGKGDETCRFVMAPPDRLEKRIAEYVGRHPELATRVAGYRIPDFFARMREEEALRTRQGELERELRQTQKLEALGRLAGGIAHDFNNLLSIVIGQSLLIERRLPAADPMRAELAKITRAGERAASLTQQLLAFGRSQLSRREALDLNGVIDDLARMLGPVLGDDVALELALAPDAGAVFADRTQLEQVIMNLVVNAREAMPEGGSVRVTTGREGTDRVLLVVEDDGEGMDAETLAHAFEPFFTTKGDHGTGLGLSTVYGIVTQAGGTITATSAQGKGTAFRIVLPRLTAPAVSSTVVANAPGTRAARPPATVLVVEDRADLRDLIREALTAYGFDALAAATPEEALVTLADAKVKVDVLLTDVVMPRIGGLDLARRAREHRPALRVLFMSGYAPDGIQRELFATERAAFLQKPFSPDELAAKLDGLVAAGPAKGSS